MQVPAVWSSTARLAASNLRKQAFLQRQRLSTGAASSTVLVDEGVNYRLLTLNREKALNAANLPMIRELTHWFDRFEENQNIHTILMQGAGKKAFCAGGDIKALYDNGQDEQKRSKTFDFFAEEYALNYKLATSSTPVISFIDGIVMGGGVGLSLPGQYRVATGNTLFAMPETAIGFFPDVGGSFYLPRLESGAGIGMWLGLTGARLKGVDVFHAGIATHFLPQENALQNIMEEISLGNNHEESELVVFQALMEGATDQAPTWFTDNIERINNVFTVDSVEEVVANLEAEGDEWAEQTLAKLKKMSPLSVKVTFEMLKRGKKLSIADALTMEFRIAQHMMEGKDFFEGVRSVLVDRNHVPQWAHDSLQAVTSDEVEAYFRAPEGGGKFELQLPVHRGDSVAFPKDGMPSRQNILAAQIMDSPIDANDTDFEGIEALRRRDLYGEHVEQLRRDEVKQRKDHEERQRLARQLQFGDRPMTSLDEIREEILAFKQDQADSKGKGTAKLDEAQSK